MKTTLYAAISLDGFIARADGSVDWLEAFGDPNDDVGHRAFQESVDVLVMGGKTYRQMLTFGPWPYAGKSTWVYSRQPVETNPGDVLHTDAPPTELVEQLRRESKRHLWLFGGGEVNAMFLRADLIGELCLFVTPITLGTGIPLFAPPVPERTWTLLRHAPWRQGVVELHYTANPGKRASDSIHSDP